MIDHEDTPCIEDAHLDLLRSENYESPREKSWLRWINNAEQLVGHSLDGDEWWDGYSLDGAFDAWEAGVFVFVYAAQVEMMKTALLHIGG